MANRRNNHLFNLCLIILVILSFSMDLSGQEPPAIQRIIERFTGPLHLRTILQPLIAIFLGITNGRADFKSNHPPFFLDMVSDKINRNQKMKMAYRSILTPLFIGVIVDAIFQYLVFSKIHFFGAILAGIILIALPYTISRGFTNRLLRRYNK